MVIDPIMFMLYLVGGLVLLMLLYLMINDIINSYMWRKEHGSD